MTKAAPQSILRTFGQSATYRVAVNVSQLFNLLPLAENYEIVEPPLPEVSMTMAAPPIAVFDRWGNAKNFPRKRFLQRLHDNRRILSFRFSDQQVHVLGHYHVTDDYKSKPPPDLFQNFEKQIARLRIQRTEAFSESNWW